jgi:hypothetical protein
LHTRLNTRVAAGQGRNNIRRAIPRRSIAATIILLLGIGCAIYYTFLTGVRSKIVASSPPFAASPSAAPSPPPAKSTASPKQAAAPPASAAPAQPPLLARSKRPAPATEPIEEDKARYEPASPATADALSKADKADAKVYTQADTVASHQLEGLEVRAANSNSLVFSGRVLDNHDNPVPGASLILKGYRNAGTVTDQQGQFKLYLPPQDSSRYVTVAMIGYGQKSLPLTTLTANNTTDHTIHLQPSDAALEEVVVSGFASKRKETLAAVPSDREELDSLWLKARPVIGRNAYLQYLDTAQKALALDSSITGTETVSFIVDKQGTLTSFEIEQSLSPAHDEAIIRLVKEGPAWQLLKQKKDRVQVSLHF